MPDKTVIPYLDQFTNERMGLYLAMASDLYTLLYFRKWPYKRMIAYLTAVKVDGLDDGDLFTENYVL